MRPGLLLVVLLVGCGGGSGKGDVVPDSSVADEVGQDLPLPQEDALQELVAEVMGSDAADSLTGEDEVEVSVLPWVPAEPVEAVVVASNADVGKVEGLAFDGAGGLFLTGSNGDLLRVSPEGAVEVVGSIPKVEGFSTANLAGAAFDSEWGLLVLQYSGDRLCRYTEGAGVEIVRSDLDKGPNGILVGGDGYLYVTLSETGKVVRMAGPDGAMEVVAEGLSFPNGLARRGASEWLYVASTLPKGAVYRVDLSGGLPAVPELFSEHAELKAADGLVFAPDGQLLVAAFGGGKVMAVDPTDGSIATVVSAGPSSALGGVASLAFGKGEGFDPYCVYATNMLLGGLFKICPPL